MSDRRKNLIYWGTYLALLVAGAAVSVGQVLPVKNTAVFLIGLYWLWNGVSFALNVNPAYARQHIHRHKVLVSASNIGMGLVWVVIACFTASNQALPMILASAPFVLLGFWCFMHQ